MTNAATTAQRIKRLLIDKLHLEGLTPEGIADEMPLFGEGLGLDSVDALELVVALEREFSLRIQSHEVGREAFASVAALAAYVEGRLTATANPHAGS
jgi:acyl carrier protein